MRTYFLILMVTAMLTLESCPAADTPPPPQPIPSAPATKAGLASGEKLEAESQLPASNAEKLNILWTSSDKEVALKMVFMYAYNARKQGWWKEVQLIIWGPSAKLTSEDKDIQDYLKRMKNAGVIIVACRACADQYGVSKKLEGLGIEVKYMGQPLTDILKRGEKLITF